MLPKKIVACKWNWEDLQHIEYQHFIVIKGKHNNSKQGLTIKSNCNALLNTG